MIKERIRQYLVFAMFVAALLMGSPGTVMAQTSSSNDYQVTQTQFGAGSALNDCSSSYCAAKASVGDAVDGSGSSNNYQATFGADTSAEPLLEVIAQAGNSNLGTLTSTTTATATESVKVRCYLSDGYSIQIAGASPSEGGEHNLDTPTTPTASHPGTEQFGINLVANTTPSVGADPVQVPSSQTSFGEPTANYDIPNEYQYINGDIIASSATSSGETDYTISMIFNISNVTPGGNYSGNYSAVVVPAY